MPKPAQLVLGDHGLHNLTVGLSKYFCMRHMVAPGDSQDALQAYYVESLMLLVVATVSDPTFTAVKKCGHADGDFGVEVEISVLR
jgi:hypothetical protein